MSNMGKPIKPSKNLVYFYACKKRKMLFEEKSEADNFIKYNHGGILEENGKAPDGCQGTGQRHERSMMSEV